MFAGVEEDSERCECGCVCVRERVMCSARRKGRKKGLCDPLFSSPHRDKTVEAELSGRYITVRRHGEARH